MTENIYSQILAESRKDYARISTVSLHVLSDEGIIEGAGSCSICDFRDERIVITVAHNVLNGPSDILLRGGVQIGLAPGAKTEYYHPSYEWVKTLKLDEQVFNDPDFDLQKHLTKGERIDFAYALSDDKHLQPRDEVYDHETQALYSLDKQILKSDFLMRPSPDENYFFYGKVRCKPNHSNHTFQCEERFANNIKYVTKMPSNDFYIFQLETVINDMADYQGCSGAPIFNKDGAIVSVVAKGLLGSNRLLGVNINKYRSAIEASILSKRQIKSFED